MRLQAGVHLPDGPIRSYRLAALFLPFVIPLLFTMPAEVGGVSVIRLSSGLVWVLAALAIVIAVTGLLKGFPAWALPTLGALLFWVWTPLKVAAQAAILTVLRQGGRFWPDALPDRMALVARLDVAFLALAVLITLLLLLLSPPLRDRTRRDWSLLSFLLYGLAIPYVLMNDPYRGLAPYVAVSILLLAAGRGCIRTGAQTLAAAACLGRGAAAGASCPQPGHLSDIPCPDLCNAQRDIPPVGDATASDGAARAARPGLPAGPARRSAGFRQPRPGPQGTTSNLAPNRGPF